MALIHDDDLECIKGAVSLFIFIRFITLILMTTARGDPAEGCVDGIPEKEGAKDLHISMW